MKTLKNSLVFITAFCLPVACSQPYGIGENDIGPSNAGGQIAIADDPIVMVTYSQSENKVLEEIVNLKDLLNSLETDHICLYSSARQDLTLVPTVCDYLDICSSDVIGVRLYYNGFAGTDTDPSSGEVTIGKSPIKVKVTYSLSEDCLSEEILGLHDIIKFSGTDDSICLCSVDGQDITLLETACVYLCISSRDIIEITLFTD